MRIPTLLLLSGLSISAFAEPQAQPKLDPPLPPPASELQDVLEEAGVTITKETEQTVEEFRANGKLYMIKITPKHGAPYYLVDERGDGRFSRQESLDSGLRVPQWIIHKF